MLRLDPNSSLPKQGCLDLIKEINEAYKQLAIIQKEVTSTFTRITQEEDSYLDKFFRMWQDARALFYEKFDEQCSAASSFKSAKTSIQHSTPIEVRPEIDSKEEFESEEHKQKLEEERKKANAIRLEADKAKRSLLSHGMQRLGNTKNEQKCFENNGEYSMKIFKRRWALSMKLINFGSRWCSQTNFAKSQCVY